MNARNSAKKIPYQPEEEDIEQQRARLEPQILNIVERIESRYRARYDSTSPHDEAYLRACEEYEAETGVAWKPTGSYGDGT